MLPARPSAGSQAIHGAAAGHSILTPEVTAMLLAGATCGPPAKPPGPSDPLRPRTPTRLAHAPPTAAPHPASPIDGGCRTNMSDCELGTSASLRRVVPGAETRSRLEKPTLRGRFLEPAPPRAACRRDPLWGDHNTSPQSGFMRHPRGNEEARHAGRHGVTPRAGGSPLSVMTTAAGSGRKPSDRRLSRRGSGFSPSW